MKRILFLCLFLTMYPASLFADGKFYGTSYEVDPYIPRQSMIAGFRDGKETLIVESTMESSEGESFAWVVPLPAVPERMEEVAPSVMQSMRQNLKPEISRGSATDFRIGMIVLIFIITLQVGYHIGKRQFNRAMVVGVLCFPAVYFFFGVTSPFHRYGPPSMGYGYGASVETSVEEIMTAQVGNYDVSILKADVAEDLDQWLEENGFRKLDSTSLKTVQQYLDEKWVFSVARLKREGQGELTPHPLSFTFPAKAPVFPMRLTAAPEQVTHVWLYLVADEPYQCKGFDTVFRDRFEKHLDDKFHEWLQAQEYENEVSIPEKAIIDLAGEKAWITALRGELNEAAMSQDIYPTISRNKPYREKRYTPERAFEISIVTSVVFFTIGILLSALLIRDGEWFLIATATLLLLAVLIHGTLLANLPKAEKVYLSNYSASGY